MCLLIADETKRKSIHSKMIKQKSIKEVIKQKRIEDIIK